MKINKSTRHARITRDFGEAVALYWLSKCGFECARVDHTGIDIIARNPHTEETMGISVKSRSRIEGTEEAVVSIPNDHLDRADAACKAFGCVPYFAIVVDAGETVRGFILPMLHLLTLFPRAKSGTGWKMSEKCLSQYAADPKIIAFEFKTKATRWWTANNGLRAGRDRLPDGVRQAALSAKRLECVELAPAFSPAADKSAGKPPHSKRFARSEPLSR